MVCNPQIYPQLSTRLSALLTLISLRFSLLLALPSDHRYLNDRDGQHPPFTVLGIRINRNSSTW